MSYFNLDVLVHEDATYLAATDRNHSVMMVFNKTRSENHYKILQGAALSEALMKLLEPQRLKQAVTADLEFKRADAQALQMKLEESLAEIQVLEDQEAALQVQIAESLQVFF